MLAFKTLTWRSSERSRNIMDHYGVLVMLTARDWVLQGSYRFPRRLPSSSPGPLSEKMGGALPFLRKRKALGTIKCK